jgi:hypothetical protein
MVLDRPLRDRCCTSICIGNSLGTAVPLIRANALSELCYEPSLQHQGVEGCEDFLLQTAARAPPVVRVRAGGVLIGYRFSPGAMSANWVRMQRSFSAMYQIIETECQAWRLLYAGANASNTSFGCPAMATAGHFGEAASLRHYAKEYLIRIARGLAGGKSRSQARGHARAADVFRQRKPATLQALWASRERPEGDGRLSKGSGKASLRLRRCSRHAAP